MAVSCPTATQQYQDLNFPTTAVNQAEEALLPNAFSLLADDLQGLLSFLSTALSEDLELLSDKGRDRMFTSASSLLEKANLLLSHNFGAAHADTLVNTATFSCTKSRHAFLSLALEIIFSTC